MMDIRKVRDNLGRIKVYYHKGDTLRAVKFAVESFKALGSTKPPMDIRAGFSEAIQLLSRDKKIQAMVAQPLAYQPGREKELWDILEHVLALMEDAQGQEDRAVALARKQRLDQTLNLGYKLIEQGKISDADATFQEALQFYRDEHSVYQLMGSAFMNAGQARRAFPYLKKAVELQPESSVALHLLQEATQAREA